MHTTERRSGKWTPRIAALTALVVAAGCSPSGQPDDCSPSVTPRVSTADPRPGNLTQLWRDRLTTVHSLTGARIVVGAGRGAGGPDGFGPVDALAARLGGAVGVSRVVTSLGWRPHHEQVGQTGSRISPDVYIACGISGAIQHWAGCSSSKTIIAINTDGDAPMVTKANYAIVGDMHEVLPALLEQLG